MAKLSFSSPPGVNNAPALNTSGAPTLTVIDEDAVNNPGTLVSAVIASVLPLDMITDPDPGAQEGLAIIGAVAEDGVWQYSINGGSTWAALGDPSATAARLLAADANTYIRFVPHANFNGTINPAITFRAWDRTSGSNGSTADTTSNGGATAFSMAIETASLTVTPVNDQPEAVNDAANTTANTPRTIAVLANDRDLENDQLTVTALGAPAHGTATRNPNNTVTYTPSAGYSGTDGFSYTVSDPGGLTDSATVTVTVGSTNHTPNAVDDSAGTPQNTPATIAVLANDSDPDSDSLTVTALGAPVHGTATTDDATVTYTPTLNFTGTDAFSYTVSDGQLSDTATIIVSVTARATSGPATHFIFLPMIRS